MLGDRESDKAQLGIGDISEMHHIRHTYSPPTEKALSIFMFWLDAH